MNTYYLRCTEDLRDRVIALGVRLGVIQLVNAEPVPLQREGEAPPAVPYIKALGGAWDEIGYIYDDREGTPNFRKPREQGGKPLWHANLRTPINLRQRAMEMAAADPTIAAELAQLRRYFVTRPGQPDAAAAPQSPARVFA